jgi:5'-deoxynucleotidase YfbR-like HD superfamily hydrolase
MPKPPLEALTPLLALGRLPRTGWIQRGVAEPETIAAHVLGTCHVVLALGPRVKPPLDVERALCLALLHDAPEALTGDLPRAAAELLPAGAKAEAEARAAERLLAPLSDLAHERWREYRAGETREARFAKVCDRLQLGVQLVAYTRAGARGLEEFRAVVEELDCDGFAPAEALRGEILAALDA